MNIYIFSFFPKHHSNCRPRRPTLPQRRDRKCKIPKPAENWKIGARVRFGHLSKDPAQDPKSLPRCCWKL